MDALEQARTGYEKARINKQQADTKYAIGMLSKDEYLMEELDYKICRRLFSEGDSSQSCSGI